MIWLVGQGILSKLVKFKLSLFPPAPPTPKSISHAHFLKLEWKGLDTLIVAAGVVSALQPLMAIVVEYIEIPINTPCQLPRICHSSTNASTKAASLILYQALSIEHPRIAFYCLHAIPRSRRLFPCLGSRRWTCKGT